MQSRSQHGREIIPRAAGLHSSSQPPTSAICSTLPSKMLSPSLAESMTVIKSASDRELQLLETSVIGLVDRLAKLPFVSLLACLTRMIHLLNMISRCEHTSPPNLTRTSARSTGRTISKRHPKAFKTFSVACSRSVKKFSTSYRDQFMKLFK